MKIALFGNGKMGQLVATQARAAGHEIGEVITSDSGATSLNDLSARLCGHDVAIDFTVAEAVERNVTACVYARVPLVEGTTGWQSEQSGIIRIVTDQGGALIYGANFSVGVNLFYRVVARAGELFARSSDHAPFIEEAHHQQKRDAPSGTALRLHDLLKERIEREIPIASTRAGSIPGTHRVGFDSAADQILLTHTARSRAGFASGALLAANWIVGREGVFEFSQMIDEMIGPIANCRMPI
ncbi:MAG: 4-hydroxy-tetrahydrodipicolinate reductase [Acidobacteriota bacterium]|nr:4-hydroxy-tetrahydrodipicolinate reductase [Acidobacteriota bacterium]